jgi:tetratricopeptide (TPR) repeat protein
MPIQLLTLTGEKQPLPHAISSNLQPVETYLLSAANRDVQKTHTIDVQHNDKLLEFVFEDDTTWMCDAATLHEIFPEVDRLNRSVNTAFVLPAIVRSPGADRGLVGDIALKLLNVFLKKPLAKGVRMLASQLEDKMMEEGEGLLHWDKHFCFTPFNRKPSDQPYLLFLHGTNSNAKGAFGKLGQSDVWQFMHATYGRNVLAFQHRTLTKSPLQNVLELVMQLPDAAELHLISHSRGGLLGDILCRYALNQDGSSSGFTDTHTDLLRKHGERGEDIEHIRQLNNIFVNKKIRVRKFIRVACPAGGTILASRRLDIILNVFYNLFGGSLNPLADLLKELIAETLKTKDDIRVLPGLEAQSPSSPFIKILNDRAPEAAVDGDALAVIAGNGKWTASINGLKVILGKMFFWQRNDLVVNTDSMYLGAHRNGTIQYFFDQGAVVDHTSYFLNNTTRQAIAFALKTNSGEPIPGFTTVAQYSIPASDRDVRGFEHGELFPYPNLPSGKRPVVVLLPGIMGSNLSRNGDKIWLAYLRSVFGGLKELQYINDKAITATSLIRTSYKQLADRLSATYDVIIYPFDWRKPLKESADAFNDKIIELLKFNQPLKIIGHSMGGVLVRDFIVNHDDTWKKLNNSKGFKLLFLGAPLGGSFRITTVLFGNDAIINSLNMLDRKHTKKELLTMFSAFPGILNLLPLTTGEGYDFADKTTWEKMAAAYGDSNWPLPGPVQLEAFGKYRDHILEKTDTIDYSNMVYVAGKDKYTPCDYFNDTIPPRTELVFLYTGEGDQSVTWDSGIPKQLSTKSVYYVDVTHGALANEPRLFHGIEQILEKGFTDLFSRSRPVVRSEQQRFRMPEVFNFDLSERGIENALFGLTDKSDPPVNQVPLSISISNGDLAYASFPVLAGHFRFDGILYAEKSIDLMLNESLSARHHLGLYPGEVGTHTVIETEPENTDFPGAIIVGLGEPGTLSSYLLTNSVEQGVAKYLLDINSKPAIKKQIGISSLLIGCGYGGLTVESAIKAIIEGVNNANAKVVSVHKNETRTIQHIEFIELFEDRALNCLYTLKKIESRENRIYSITLANTKIKRLFGFQKRLFIDSSEAWWNRIRVKCKKMVENGITTSSLIFNASTGDAREEENELFSSTSLIDLFIEQASTQNHWTAPAARTLFELMIPHAFKDRLKKKSNISWILDEDTAAYPWELLQENTGQAKPLCIDAGMIRQLTTTNYRVNIKRVATEQALVVADPLLIDYASQLPGAAKEGQVTGELLTTYGFPNKTLINPTAAEIVLNLFSNDYKIIHLAGHGVYNPKIRQKSGMLIGKDVFLTTADIEQLSAVPELVFVNCCYLGKTDAMDEKYYDERYKLAASIGTQLIRMGVKAVIAAGWAVEDRAAADFASVFYTRLFAGYNFGDAVRDARGFIYDKYGKTNNTWGAYQCYGDPFYKLINRGSDVKEEPLEYVLEEEVVIDLTNLRNDLDTKNYTPAAVIHRLKHITDAIEKAEIRSGEIMELQAAIYYELGDYKEAIELYEALREEENANFSVSALERYCTARAKKVVQDFKFGLDMAQISNMNTVIRELNELIKINKTAERLNLLGSAYKRKGMVTTTADEKLAAYTSASEKYKEAFEIGQKPYSLNKWLTLESALFMVNSIPMARVRYGTKKREEMIELVDFLKAQLEPQYTNMDYWGLINDTSFELSLLLLDAKRAQEGAHWNKIAKQFQRLWKSSGSRGKKMAEIESLEILSDVLNLSEKSPAQHLKRHIDELREKLELALE